MIPTTTTCPYCQHDNPREVRAMIGKKRGDHFCERCGQQYWEHYEVRVLAEGIPIPERFRLHRQTMETGG